MHYLIYKITNNLNNKIYIGAHKTADIDDDYMGSGKILQRAIKKYGLENFTKEILHIFDTSEEMFNMESILVNEDFVKNTNTYNLKEGGYGGWDYVNILGFSNYENYSNESKLSHKLGSRRGGINTVTNKLGLHSLSKTENLKNSRKGWKATKANFTEGQTGNFEGRKHTVETKEKMSKSSKGKYTGSKNSQYGTMWITNEEVNKKIKKDELIPVGFRKGRKTN